MIIKRNSWMLSAVAVSAFVLALPLASHAQVTGGPPSVTDQLSKLSAEWWQWALSIPSSVNPLQDATGEHCMAGHRGDVWFLAGTFTGEPAKRDCTVSEEAELFFPVANYIFINIKCDGSEWEPKTTIEEARAEAAENVENTEIVTVELDGKPITSVSRVQSKVFWVALPEDNLFDEPCENESNTPVGVYSYAVDDGYYVRLKPLPVGEHTLRFETTGAISQDITYALTVEPVRLK